MKNLSIRTRILAVVVIVNLLGAIGVVVYMHQSYSKGLDTTVTRTATEGVAAWEQIKGPDVDLDPLASPEEVQRVLMSMNAVTGADYGFMLDKSITDADSYEALRGQLGEASNWDEGDTYALLAVTDEAVAARMEFSLSPDSVPEMGKIVGVENGACSKTCHDGVTGEGDYWSVKWSEDSTTRGHAVFPVTDASGNPIGLVYAVQNITEQADAARTSMMQTVLVVGITLIVATLVIGGLVDTLVLKRLARMTTSIEDISMRVAGGEFDARYVPGESTDEIGSFERFFADFIDVMSATLKTLSEKKKD